MDLLEYQGKQLLARHGIPVGRGSEAGMANVGIIPHALFREGNVGVVSRSGTLTYQIGNELAQRGIGNSTIVGIGGDPVPGEIGGAAEELVAGMLVA